MARQLTRTLEILLTSSIDYAGVFPPASLSVASAVENYLEYSQDQFAWILRRLVISSEHLSDPAVSSLLRANNPATPNGVLAVVSDTDHSEASSIESKTIVAFGKPTYCEIPQDRLVDVLCVGSAAKIRMGGVTPEGIPNSESVANFIHACAQQRLAFKATAGLHHPIRSIQPLAYESDAPRAMLHGFINLLMASAFSWQGSDVENICLILDETDPGAFCFEDTKACWRDHCLSARDMKEARRDFVHSFGSCSFIDPIHDLKELGWL